MPSASLTITGLTKRYGDFVALAPTDLEVAQGEFLTLLGPSGSGKTTLLSLIAGLASADGGQLLIDGQDVDLWRAVRARHRHGVPELRAVPAHDRRGEHRVPAARCARSIRRARERARVARRSSWCGCRSVAQRFPRELSGGQQQRIALARASSSSPSIVLMDEPLGALDKKLRDQMQLEIKRIHRELGTTIVYVTHDQEEALTMSDRICLMNHGRIEQLGTPADLYFRPRTLVRGRLPRRVQPARRHRGTHRRRRGGRDARAGRRSRTRNRAHAVAAGSKVRVMVRPQNIDVRSDARRRQRGARQGARQHDHRQPDQAVRRRRPRPAASRWCCVIPTSSGAAPHAIGDDVTLHWNGGDAVAVPEAA